MILTDPSLVAIVQSHHGTTQIVERSREEHVDGRGRTEHNRPRGVDYMNINVRSSSEFTPSIYERLWNGAPIRRPRGITSSVSCNPTVKPFVRTIQEVTNQINKAPNRQWYAVLRSANVSWLFNSGAPVVDSDKTELIWFGTRAMLGRFHAMTSASVSVPQLSFQWTTYTSWAFSYRQQPWNGEAH